MKISVLLVMPRERRLSLLEQLEACRIEVLPVSDCEEARRMIRTRPSVQVVLTDEILHDGGWSSVLDEVWETELNAETIVCTRLEDPALWVHALARGAYDVLVQPYEVKEVRRIVEGAAASRVSAGEKSNISCHQEFIQQ